MLTIANVHMHWTRALTLISVKWIAVPDKLSPIWKRRSKDNNQPAYDHKDELNTWALFQRLRKSKIRHR